MRPPFSSTAVEEAYAHFPLAERVELLRLRALLFEVAASTPGVGPLEETLKWGEPAYLTTRTKSGSTIRLGLARPTGIAILVHCRTSILREFRDIHGDSIRRDGERALLFEAGEPIDEDMVTTLFHLALTYHSRRRQNRAG